MDAPWRKRAKNTTFMLSNVENSTYFIYLTTDWFKQHKMLKRLWILGHGRILVDGQFLVDYSRLQLFLDDRPMPKCVRDGTKLLFERLGSDYYVFTKYMNQTLGNMCFETLRKLTSSKHLVLRHHTLL